MTSSIFFFFFFFFLIALLLSASIFSVTTASYGQGEMRSSTSGNSLDIRIEPRWSDGGKASFKVSFLRHGTDTLQEHVDYNFVIMKDSQQIFSAAAPLGQPSLHTVEGIVTIPIPTAPYIFPNNGDYSIEISVSGISFTPINTETATFSVTVTPEFPTGALAALAAFITTTIVLARRRKLL
jgi:hypothetical protein